MSDDSGQESLKIETKGLVEFKRTLITGFLIAIFGIICQLISIGWEYYLWSGSLEEIIRDIDDGDHKVIAGIWIGGMIIQIIGFITIIKGLNQLYNYLRIDITNQDHNLDLILNAVNKLDGKIESADIMQPNKISQTIGYEQYKDNNTPNKSMKHDSIDSSGYEWLKFDDSNWYRTAGSESEWLKFDE